MITLLRHTAMILCLCLACLGAAEAASSKKPTKPSTDSKGKISQANGIPLALLSSQYRHVEKSGTATKWPEREAALVFHPSGAAFLLVWKGVLEWKDFQKKKEESGILPHEPLYPDEIYEKINVYEAKFSYSRGVLNLQFDSDEFARNVSFPLDLAASKVTMPFQVFSPKKGRSTWERSDGWGLIGNVSLLCTAIVRARNADRVTTTILLAKYLEPFVHQPGTPEIDVSPAPPIDSITSFRLRPGSLDIKLDGSPGFVGGIFHDCFRGSSASEPNSLPCSDNYLICTPKGCSCEQENAKFQIVPGEFIISGSCDRGQIDEVNNPYAFFNGNRGLHGMLTCYNYNQELKKNPDLAAGEKTLSFTINSIGKIRDAQITMSATNNNKLEKGSLSFTYDWIDGELMLASVTVAKPDGNDLEECLRTYFRLATFPAPKDGGECRINYTFTIKAIPSAIVPLKDDGDTPK